ncbi:MAG: hypothetical protein JSW60_01460 [Thermoplasmatales archaeon]|nr:MAG: hypothetical protein JSW60_01460 [Thermoplasmatales archaeon]
MDKKISVIFFILSLTILSSGMASAYENDVGVAGKKTTSVSLGNSEDYAVQWEMNYGSDWSYGARYEGPQPIGDCDNDGDNELLIGGRDAVLRVMEWDEAKQTYEETYALRCPFYRWLSFLKRLGLSNGPIDAAGFAIGDLTGDGKNEIAATWYAAIHKWIGGKYRIIGFNPWVFQNGKGNADCYIGDCDNDGRNELIMSGGPMRHGSQAPQIVVFKWNGWRLVKVAEWYDSDPNGYVYMAGLGDIDEDGENEIVCGSAYKIIVLDWDKENEEFVSTIIKHTSGDDYPFACVCKDSDMDGKNEIHVGYWTPKITIFEWDGDSYVTKFEKEWSGEWAVIEGLDVGDVDDDGVAEVCAGTHNIHILEWNGSTYVEEAVIDETFGSLAVVAIGDIDNDGKNEINAGSVMVYPGQDFKSWIFKHGWESN